MTNFVSQYFDNKKLKRQIRHLQDDFRKEKDLAKKRTPSSLTKQGESLAKEWDDRYVAAQVKGKALQTTVDELTVLVNEVKGWQTSPLENPQPKPTPTPQTLTEAALKLLLLRAEGIVKVLNDAGVVVPGSVTAAVESGKTTLAQWNNKQPTERSAAAQSLEQLLRLGDALCGFAQAWKSGNEQQQRRLRLPPPQAAPRIWARVQDTWPSTSQTIAGVLKGVSLTEVSKVSTLGSMLKQATESDVLQRSKLLEEVEATELLRVKAEAALKDARLNPSLSLQVADIWYQQGKNRLLNAETTEQLKEAQSELASVQGRIQDAINNLKGNSPDIYKAREAYEKQRAKARQLISKAQKVRGAMDGKSDVFVAIAKVLKWFNDAELLFTTETTLEALKTAKGLIDKVLDSGIVETAQKLSKTEKKNTEKDLEALPQYQQRMDELRKQRKAVSECFGAHEELKTLDILLAGCRVLDHGRPDGGFAAALKRIQQADPEKLLKQAQEKNKRIEEAPLNQGGDGVLNQALQALKTYATVHTPYDVAVKRQALVELTAGNGPKEELPQFVQSLGTEVEQQKQRLVTLDEKLKAQAKELDELQKLGKKPDDPELLTLRKRLEDTASMLKEWRLDVAELELGRVESLTSEQVDLYKKATESLKDRKVRLNELLTKARAWVESWGPAAVVARSIVVEVPRLLGLIETLEIDPVQALRRADDFLSNGQRLLEDGIKRCGLGGESQRLEGLAKKRNELQDQWTQATKRAQLAMERLNPPLISAGVPGGVKSMGWPDELATLNSRWDKIDHVLKAEGDETAAQALQREFSLLLNALEEFERELPDPENLNEQKFTDSVERGKQNENMAQWRRAYDTATTLLREVQADLQYQKDSGKATKVPLPEDIAPPNKVELALGDSFEGANPNAENGLRWKAMAESMARWLVQRRQEIRGEKTPLLQEGERLKKAVKLKLGDRQKVRFRGLFEDLSKRLDDALRMLATDDVSLVKAAEKEITSIRLMLADAQGKGGKGAVTLSRLEKRLSELSHLLGDGYHVQRRLPLTYARLKPQLDNAWQTAKKVGPEEGMRLLEALQEPITRARKEAKQLTLEYEAFKLRREAVEELHDELKGHTDTKLGNRTTAYNERLKARLEEAHGLARQEGRLGDAFKALQVIENELKLWLSQPKDQARAGLLEAEAEAENDQRELRDLARAWNARQEYWEKEGLPAVEKAMKKREEDLQEYESLKAAMLNIGKTLAPYLDVVSAVPHKRGLSNGAPDMPTARTAFSQASLRLAQLEKVAQRLTEGNQSTNVSLSEDFEALAKEWKERTEKVATDLAAVTLELRQLPGMAVVTEDGKPKTEGQNGEQQEPPKKDTTPMLSKAAFESLNVSLKAVEQGLRTMSTRFPAESFAKAFSTLQADNSAATERRKAREEALRTVHVLKADLVDNPLLRGLFEGAQQGLIAHDPRPSLGLLRATLKKIELAALVGV